MLFPRSECCVIDSFFLAASFSFMFYQKCPTSQPHSLRVPSIHISSLLFFEAKPANPFITTVISSGKQIPSTGSLYKGKFVLRKSKSVFW